jgi:hypothetical protein
MIIPRAVESEERLSRARGNQSARKLVQPWTKGRKEQEKRKDMTGPREIIIIIIINRVQYCNNLLIIKLPVC